MKKNLRTILVPIALLVSAAMISGCKKSEGGSQAKAGKSQVMTIDIYDCAANFQGLQPGWFAKIIKDKFNVEFNIIAPNISGNPDALYQTRCASGNLGDIIIIENGKVQECIDANLRMDLTEIIPTMKNLSKFSDKINAFNGTLNIPKGKVYSLPGGMSDAGATGYGLTKMNGPFIPWDYYVELGRPKIDNDTQLLELFSKMMKKHPVNEDGDPAYAFSLWSSWDGSSVENVNQIVPWYGEQVNESLLIDAKGNMKDITSDDGAYKKMIKFLYNANKMGLVDPDSTTQGWDDACTKMQHKQVYLFWYWWQTGFWNSNDRAANLDGFVYIPVSSHHYLQTGDSSFGDGRNWSIGSKVDGAKKAKIIEILDWMASEEGLHYIHLGMEGFNYRIKSDGSYEMIKENENAMNDNTKVPDEFGGGGYGDGMNKINCYLVSSETINPKTGEPYASDRWASYVESSRTALTDAWAKQFGYPDQVAYLKGKKMVDFIPNVNICLDQDTSDVGLIRSQCTPVLKDTTWKMIVAANDTEFETLWKDMKAQLNGYGWKEVVNFDKAKYKKLVEARKNALK